MQDYDQFSLGASLGVAVREFPSSRVSGLYADYLLFIDWEAVGVVEAKPEGTTSVGVEEQTGGYLSSLPEEIPHSASPLPFGYESTGKEIICGQQGIHAPLAPRLRLPQARRNSLEMRDFRLHR